MSKLWGSNIFASFTQALLNSRWQPSMYSAVCLHSVETYRVFPTARIQLYAIRRLVKSWFKLPRTIQHEQGPRVALACCVCHSGSHIRSLHFNIQEERQKSGYSLLVRPPRPTTPVSYRECRNFPRRHLVRGLQPVEERLRSVVCEFDYA